MLVTKRKSVLNGGRFENTWNASFGADGKPDLAKLQTVLLVDDDDALRQVMEASLSMMGYDVIACPDAQTASLAFHSSQVDVLLTDLQMPGRSGVELARELTLLHPALPVMIISGSLLTGELSSEIQRRNWRFVNKPCRPPGLAADIQSLLQARHESTA